MSRQALHVDAVGSTNLVAAYTASRASKPRLLDRKRLATTQLTKTDVVLLALIDGRRTVQRIIDAAALPEREVMRTLARLEHLGIITASA